MGLTLSLEEKKVLIDALVRGGAASDENPSHPLSHDVMWRCIQMLASECTPLRSSGGSGGLAVGQLSNTSTFHFCCFGVAMTELTEYSGTAKELIRHVCSLFQEAQFSHSLTGMSVSSSTEPWFRYVRGDGIAVESPAHKYKIPVQPSTSCYAADDSGQTPFQNPKHYLLVSKTDPSSLVERSMEADLDNLLATQEWSLSGEISQRRQYDRPRVLSHHMGSSAPSPSTYFCPGYGRYEFTRTSYDTHSLSEALTQEVFTH